MAASLKHLRNHAVAEIVDAVIRTRHVLLLAVPLALLWSAPTADASLKAKPSLTTKSGATRIVVKLASSSRLSPRSRPRSVSVKAGRRIYKLKRVRGAQTAAVSLGTWRSAAYRGSAAAKLLALTGKRVAVRVRSRAGTSSVRSKLAGPPGGTAPPGGTQPGDITGQQAIDQLTAEIRGGSVRRLPTSGDLSESFELHLCADGRFRYY